jgi:hypothetical protein
MPVRAASMEANPKGAFRREKEKRLGRSNKRSSDMATWSKCTLWAESDAKQDIFINLDNVLHIEPVQLGSHVLLRDGIRLHVTQGADTVIQTMSPQFSRIG